MEDDDLDDEDDELASNPLVQRATAALAADVKVSTVADSRGSTMALWYFVTL